MPLERQRAWRGIKFSLETAFSFVTRGPWAALGKILEFTIETAIDHLSEAYCLTFTGKMSGHTYVEALDNGRPFYGLDNDWEGEVFLMGAKPTGNEKVKFRGTLTGRETNFKAKNWLHVLYPKAPASLTFLTVDPSPIMAVSAVFIAYLEALLEGGEMTLMIKNKGLDFDGRITATMAVIVIPFASPIPIIHKFQIPFQGGIWQAYRAIGDKGTAVQRITAETNKRIVRAELSRELSNAGANGRFAMKIELCGGSKCQK